MKNIVIITSSPRRNSNSSALAREFARGAEESGNKVEIISLVGKHMEYCRGCMACMKTGKCIIRDDMAEVNEKMYNAEVLVFATPIYYYCISAQLKTAFDRANPLYGSDYKFREVYLLASSADDAPETVDGAVKATQGWVDCFEKARLVQTVFAGGVSTPGEIAGHAALQEAYQAGKVIF